MKNDFGKIILQFLIASTFEFINYQFNWIDLALVNLFNQKKCIKEHYKAIRKYKHTNLKAETSNLKEKKYFKAKRSRWYQKYGHLFT